MELHKNTANSFINYLIQHGYPEDRIVIEWGDKSHRIDIAILDESKNFPVAIYEIKGKRDMNSVLRGLLQLKRFIDYLDYSVESGLVFSKAESPYFEFYEVNDYLSMSDKKRIYNEFVTKNDMANTEPINYKNISNSKELQIILNQERKKKKYLDSFRIICWLLICPIIFELILLDAFGVYQLTTARLTILGFLILIGSAPFFSEIKYGNWHLKRPDAKNDLKEEEK